MKKMKKIILFMMCIALISLASAGLIGPFKQGQDINLPQTCDDCTYNNITSILYPNSSIAISNVQMAKDGTFFSYTLNGGYTNILGTYIINGVGDLNGVATVWAYDFDVTPTGETQNPVWNNAIAIFLGILAVILIIAAVKLEAPWMGFISAVIFLLLGIYLMIYGFNDITNTYTRGIAITILGIGFVLLAFSAYEWWLSGKGEEE